MSAAAAAFAMAPDVMPYPASLCPTVPFNYMQDWVRQHPAEFDNRENVPAFVVDTEDNSIAAKCVDAEAALVSWDVCQACFSKRGRAPRDVVFMKLDGLDESTAPLNWETALDSYKAKMFDCLVVVIDKAVGRALFHLRTPAKLYEFEKLDDAVEIAQYELGLGKVFFEPAYLNRIDPSSEILYYVTPRTEWPQGSVPREVVRAGHVALICPGGPLTQFPRLNFAPMVSYLETHCNDPRADVWANVRPVDKQALKALFLISGDLLALPVMPEEERAFYFPSARARASSSK